MTEHLKYFKWTTWGYLIGALVWLLSFASTHVWSTFACFVALLSLAWYDYALNRTMWMLESVCGEELS